MTSGFCKLFEVDHPIVLAPMGGAVTPELAAAVSNAGGLGIAPVWHLELADARDFLHRIKDLTDKPFGVNLNMGFPSLPHLDACLEAEVPVISLFWEQPGDFVARAQGGGAKVIYSAGNVAGARAAADLGVDAICAQGWEAGGHVRGRVGTLALVPAVVDAVGDIPVIAAGGIADGRGVAAACALGASAAWIGTRFLAAHEASVHPDYLAALMRASEDDTEYCENLYDIGWPDAPHRIIRNSTFELWADAGRAPLGQRPGEGDVVGSSPRKGNLLRYQSNTPDKTLDGDIEAMSMWAGQGVSMVQRKQPAAEIVQEIAREAREILDRMGRSGD